MARGMVAAAMWIAILGYWALYHGVQMLSTLGQSASSSSSSGTGGGDPLGHLRNQPIP